MKYSITINQKAAMEHGIDWIDAGIFNTIAEMLNSPGLEARIIDGRVYKWLSLKLILGEIPASGLTSKRALQVRMDKLRSKKLISTMCLIDEGNKLLVSAGQNYDSMIYTSNKSDTPYQLPTNPKKQVENRVAHQTAIGSASNGARGSEQNGTTLAHQTSHYPNTTPCTNNPLPKTKKKTSSPKQPDPYFDCYTDAYKHLFGQEIARVPGSSIGKAKREWVAEGRTIEQWAEFVKWLFAQEWFQKTGAAPHHLGRAETLNQWVASKAAPKSSVPYSIRKGTLEHDLKIINSLAERDIEAARKMWDEGGFQKEADALGFGKRP